MTGWRRSERSSGAAAGSGVRLLTGADQLAPFLSELHVLVSVLPGGAETQGIIDGALLARLPRGAAFVNCGRGQSVVEADLLAALECGQLSRATLDVTAQEPLPAESPLWAHPRVRLTPHVSGPSGEGAGAKQMIDNWRRLRAGQPLAHEVKLLAPQQ